MSPWNLRFGKFLMEEKGKAVTIEIDDDEEDLQALINEIEEAEDMEDDVQLVCSAVKFPKHIPP